jgi:anti-sigma factor RsiW
LINKAKIYQPARPDHTCKDEVGLIADYLAGALKPPVLAAFEQHLAQCPDCMAFVKTYKKTMETTRSLLKMASLKLTPLSLRAPPTAIRLIVTFMLWLHLFISNAALIIQ